MAHWELILKALAGVKEWRFTGIAGVACSDALSKAERFFSLGLFFIGADGNGTRSRSRLAFDIYVWRAFR
jgi:hypothetical protein